VIVLDTHIIIWDALSPERLSPRAKEAIYLAKKIKRDRQNLNKNK